MKEFILVEFIFTLDEYNVEVSKLLELGDDFELIECDEEFDVDEDGLFFGYKRVSGKLNSATATLLKLQDPTFTEKANISYIPDELKDRYR